VEREGRIIAHVGLWPITVRTEGGSERGVQMIDWAADPQAAGAGVSLLQRLTKSYDFVYSIGGSEMTQTILPKFGFRTVAKALTFARPLRPFRQILKHQTRDVLLPLRLARNIWWSKMPAYKPAREWSAVEATASDWAAVSTLTHERGEGFFRYLQQCPAARFLGFRILHEGRRSGFFALSVVGEQTRVAGVLPEEPSPEHWRAALSLAQAAALRFTNTSELVARTSAEAGKVAAPQAGMRLRGQAPVFLFRRRDKEAGLPLQCQMWDDDSAFLGGSSPEFLT
jgi:hypothetical protein